MPPKIVSWVKILSYFGVGVFEITHKDIDVAGLVQVKGELVPDGDFQSMWET